MTVCYYFLLIFPAPVKLCFLFISLFWGLDDFTNAWYRAEFAYSSAWLATDPEQWGTVEEEEEPFVLFCEPEL